MLIADSLTAGLSTLEIAFYVLACAALVIWLASWAIRALSR